MKTRTLRVVLFSVWCVLFLVYVGMFLAVGRWREAIDVAEARDAARQVAYIFLPALSAFAGFWFTPEEDKKTAGHEIRDDDTVSFDRIFATFALTALVHIVVLGYFFMYVVFGEFSFSPDPSESFTAATSWGLNLLVILSTLVLLPVGYLTKRKVIPYSQPEQRVAHDRTDGSS